MALRKHFAAALVVSTMMFAGGASAQEATTQPTPPLPPNAPTTAPPPASPAGPEHRIMTTIDAGREGVVLERHVKTEESSGRIAIVIPTHSTVDGWERVCVTPCKVELPKYASYRIARANGVSRSSEFTLPQSKDTLKLDVEPGDLWWNRTARVVLGAGTAAAITGGAIIALASTFDNEKDVRIAGIITAGAGLVLVAVGIPMMLGSKTHVKTDGQKVAETKPHLTANGFVF